MKYNWSAMTEQQKIKACQEEIDLITHNGTTKDDLLNILRWLWDKFEVVLVEGKSRIDIELLEKIEKALEIKLKDWQKDYILDIPRVLDMRITGRCTGKTLAYVIKLLFSENKPLAAYRDRQVAEYSDWFSVTNRPERKEPHYTQWFRRYLWDICTALKENGLQPRPVFFSKEEEERFYLNDKG
jgi:hypothetical protein